MARILVMGFDGFGKVGYNPSAELSRWLANKYPDDCLAVILPTSYARASEEIKRLIRQHKPEAIIIFGYSSKAKPVKLEKYAKNGDNSTNLDNDGQAGRAGIVQAAPATYPSTLPLAKIYSRLQAANIPAALSEDAGGFVCNHVMFAALNEVAKQKVNIPCGLIHISKMDSETRPKLKTAARIIFDSVCEKFKTA